MLFLPAISGDLRRPSLLGFTRSMRYRLRTLMILLGVGPPILALAIQYPDASVHVVGAVLVLGMVAALLGVIVAGFLLFTGYR
jgi:hypothetical protein